MSQQEIHSFHIPVLGLAYSIDTPVKVAKFGISSVVSIMDDQLIEKMREYHCLQNCKSYIPIEDREDDFRARRITAYLDLINELVNQQIERLRNLSFDSNSDLDKYISLLPEESSAKKLYNEMKEVDEESEKTQLQDRIRLYIKPGAIDVNIMSKVDRNNVDAAGKDLPVEYSDALAAFRGYANSTLRSSVIFSAGYNPRLYNYVEQFPDFLPDENGELKKKIVLKVSDYRSALVQGKIFAKKGLWVSEFRIESGLNCGGHAFATEGLLLGPILEEFKTKKDELYAELFELCKTALAEKGRASLIKGPGLRLSVQGGIGTSNENDFLIEHYSLDRTGWGSPFLLVPEATNVDDTTLSDLATAKKEDYYLSNASPLGIPFNNFRKSSSEKQRHLRIAKGRPGSPCYKRFLSSNTEFTEEPICTSSREYQKHKINQLKKRGLPAELFEKEYQTITEKDCLCEGLGAAVLLKDEVPLSHKLSAVTICPGPNLAYFSGIFSLSEMVGHIYGRFNILNSVYRPHMFVNELNLYIEYYRKKIEAAINPGSKEIKSLNTFKTNLLSGIEYYRELTTKLKKESSAYIETMRTELENAAKTIIELKVSISAV